MNNIYQHLIRIAKSERSQRLAAITNILNEQNIPYRVQNFDSGKNIIITFSGRSDLDMIFMAHHDIASGTMQGANDNTASVAILIALSEWLKTQNLHYNIHIALTDHEERIGAMLSENVSNEDRFRIITSVGSYQLLKTFSPARVRAVINLEMSGIGDKLFFAESSGNVPCSASLNSRLAEAADILHIPHSSIKISNSDLLSVHVRKMCGTVIGALPSSENVKFGSYDIPKEWATMHSPQDTVDKIDTDSMNMILNFLKQIIK
jgi:Zn-dependent M28 family amino/carboxypeptidase